MNTALNFVREGTRESCARLCAVMCFATGCVSWLATEVFAFVYPAQHQMVDALAKGPMTLTAIAGVAIITRKRKPDAVAGGTP